MREIKFRGKRVDNGEWVYGDIIHSAWKTFTKDCNDKYTNPRRLAENTADFRCIEVAPSTVGQYTGLKDKNGREIYEGDIIWWGKDEPAPASNVIFDDGAFKVSDTRELLADVLNGAEVISNIHDSPDFLGVTK